MFVQHLLAIIFVAGYGAELVAAASSLYIPLVATEGAPITVDVEGVDDTGHTTYLVQLGTPSGTFTANDLLLPPATLVADATTVHMVDNLPGPSGLAYTVDCSISNGEAACVAAASAFGMTTLVTTTEPASSIEVQVAAAPTSAPTTDAPGAATTMPTSGSTGSSGSAAPSSTKKPDNGAGGYGPSIAGYSVIAAVSVYFLCESVVMVVLSWRSRRA
ncbi:hypothetical protein FKP32DRAFT_1340468 [Trametes sanguinea]|nr:hypothetical protein FKP32DRAFT_1340468 [Trametes sanguinea]